MKAMFQFLKTTLVGGLLFLVPIMALLFFLGKALALAHKVVAPLATRLPAEAVVGLPMVLLLAILALVLFCFLAGLCARTALAQRATRNLEQAVLSKLPGYDLLKGMGESMLGFEKEGGYAVVLVRSDDNVQLGFEVDRAQDLVAVFVPDAPNPRAGTLLFFSPDRVTPAGISMAQAMKCLKHYGAGSGTWLRSLPRPAVQ
jgi:uncharacterized membrane protein